MKSVEQNNILALIERTKLHNANSGEMNTLQLMQNFPTQKWYNWNVSK